MDACTSVSPAKEVDICVYGGTEAGVIAAYSAKMTGKSVVLIEFVSGKLYPVRLRQLVTAESDIDLFLDTHAYDVSAVVDSFALVWVSHVLSTHETYRLLGDYVINENDIIEQVLFPDRVVYGGWGQDEIPWE